MRFLSDFFSRLNIYKIYIGYKSTFYNYRHYILKKEKKALKSDIWIFVIFPIIVSVILGFLDNGFMRENWGILISCLSIFAALLFSFLTLVYTAADKEKEDIENNKTESTVRFDYIIEIFKQISFAIAISIISICLLFILQIHFGKILARIFLCLNRLFDSGRINEIINIIREYSIYILSGLKVIYQSIIYFCLIQFLLSLFVILNRFYLMFLSKFKS